MYILVSESLWGWVERSEHVCVGILQQMPHITHVRTIKNGAGVASCIIDTSSRPLISTPINKAMTATISAARRDLP